MKTLKVWGINQKGCSDICSLCCTAIEFCGISAGGKGFIVDGLPADVGIGIVLPIRSSHLATGLPALLCIGIPPVAL